MSQKTIVATGLAGFIGANFLKYFTRKKLNQDYKLIVIDALTYSGFYDSIKPDIEKNENIEFHHIDIVDNKKILSIFENEEIYGVLNFAAESHVDRSIETPNIFIETNVLGTLNLLNSSLQTFNKTKSFRFLQVSTDEVYGTLSEEDPAFMETTPLDPSSPYSASKASADCLVNSYYKTFGLPTIITRCSNNYGPYQFPEKLIPLMISNALRDKELPVYGDGRNIRDWIYVEDHVDGIWKAFTSGTPGEVYNFGGDSELRNIHVVEQILDSLDKPKSLIKFVTDRLGHDWRYAIDFEKAKNELNWSPTVDFKEGLKRTVAWYLDNKDWIENVQNKN